METSRWDRVITALGNTLNTTNSFSAYDNVCNDYVLANDTVMSNGENENLDSYDTSKYIIFDTETSGLDAGFNVILSLSYQVINAETWEVIKEKNFYFAWPTNEQRVSSEAIMINGLTKEFLSNQLISDRREALEEFMEDLENSDLVVAHNIDFDKSFVKATCAEYGVHYNSDSWSNNFDTMKEMTDYCDLHNEFGSGRKWPKLAELAKVLHVDCSDIDFHKSSSDVELTKRCFKEIVKKGIYSADDYNVDTIKATMVVNSADDIRICYCQFGKPIDSDRLSAKQKNDAKKQLYRMWAKENQEETDDIVRGYRYAPMIKSEKDFQIEYDNISCKQYERAKYTEQPISKDEIKQRLEEEAKQKFNSLLFWKNKVAREEYVSSNLESQYVSQQLAYNERVEQFNKEQDEKEESFNKQAFNDFQEKKLLFEKRLHGDRDLIIKEVNQIPTHLCHPLNVAVDAEVGDDCCNIELKIQLPSIDEMPKLTSVRLTNGTYKIKELTTKAIQANYAECITGLGYLFAAHSFNITPQIKQIQVHGLMPSVNPFGQPIKIEIYTFTLTRDQIQGIDFTQLNPVEGLKLIPHTFNLPKDICPKPLSHEDKSLMELEKSDSYKNSHPLDPLFREAAKYVVLNQEVTASKLQRNFEIGYNRAGKILDQLEITGIVGASVNGNKRQILVDDDEQLERLLNKIGI